MHKLLACVTIGCSVLLIQGCGERAASVAPSEVVANQSSAVRAVRIGGAPTGNGSLTVGRTVQLRAVAQLADGSERDLTDLVTWTSANPAVATVTASGLVTAIGPGAGRILASYQDVIGETTFTVARQSTGEEPKDPPSDSGGTSPSPGGPGPTDTPGPTIPGAPPIIQSITIRGDHTLPVGKSVQLRAIAHMSDGSEKDVTGSANWRSENSLIGSISQTGVLTGVSPGSNVVSAKYDGATASQPVTVTPL